MCCLVRGTVRNWDYELGQCAPSVVWAVRDSRDARYEAAVIHRTVETTELNVTTFLAALQSWTGQSFSTDLLNRNLVASVFVDLVDGPIQFRSESWQHDASSVLVERDALGEATARSEAGGRGMEEALTHVM